MPRPRRKPRTRIEVAEDRIRDLEAKLAAGSPYPGVLTRWRGELSRTRHWIAYLEQRLQGGR